MAHISSLFFLYTTWISGTEPAQFPERLGLTVANAGGHNEIRAQYSGFFFAAALVCVASLPGTLPRQAAYIVLVMIFGGLLVGRLVSTVLDGGMAGYGSTIVPLHAIDAGGLALAVAALALQPRP
ncbi:MAG TPA: DUF4345 family protein [Stellaceae bacterium]